MSEVIRPNKLANFIGNTAVKKQLEIILESTRETNQVFPHSIFYGFAGTGKTTLAKIISNETGCPVTTITGNSIRKQRDLLFLLWDIYDKAIDAGKPAILFIDEIHSLASGSGELDLSIWLPIIEEYTFYNNMKGEQVDYDGRKLEITSNDIHFPPFTIIGATTDIADLNDAFRRRFPVQCFMQSYTVEELTQIVQLHAEKRGIKITASASLNIARRSRFNPSVSVSLLENCRYYQTARKFQEMNDTVVNEEMGMIGVDTSGLRYEDTRILETLAET